MVMGMWQEMPILNTLMTAEGGNVVSGTKLTLRGLLFTDDKGAFEGEAAEQVPTVQNGGISADGKTITYKLRKGLTWHDGAKVTAESFRKTKPESPVKFCDRRALPSKTPRAWCRWLMAAPARRRSIKS